MHRRSALPLPILVLSSAVALVGILVVAVPAGKAAGGPSARTLPHRPSQLGPVDQYLWIDCAQVSGTVTFTPSLTMVKRKKAVDATMTVKAGSCKNTHPSVVVPKSGSGTIVISGLTECGSLLNGSSDVVSGRLTWPKTPGDFPPSIFAFSGFTGSLEASGLLHLALPATASGGSTGGAGTAAVIGSFPGGENGASSTLTITSKTPTGKACSSKSGLKSLAFTGEKLVLG